MSPTLILVILKAEDPLCPLVSEADQAFSIGKDDRAGDLVQSVRQNWSMSGSIG
jgi:hypothetical protein